MKKIAFFVEGQTEQFFLNKLLIEIAGAKNVNILLKKFKGRGRPTEDIVPKSLAQGTIEVQHTILIYDCGGDESVKTRILEEYSGLTTDGYTEIVGFRDLYPLPISGLPKLTQRLKNGLTINGRIVEEPLPNNTSIIIAVREIEDWFLAEYNHYTRIHATLILDATQITGLGFNPCVDDLTLRNTSAADDLRSVYQLAGTTYNKSKNRVERTVECLDYANLYLEIRNRMAKLNELITKIDNFLT
ncbi:hypothetical protein [Flectobacillus longus]|uniref:hypothetical protein n=1 Tax=Flectobacillus longus TaxID=2984207 RepID=UPI0024B72526|nr:hypothetical protein [Flectobacillus longus]MDI9880030.1 hypothetical protein [Flectobacillus longus]